MKRMLNVGWLYLISAVGLPGTTAVAQDSELQGLRPEPQERFTIQEASTLRSRELIDTSSDGLLFVNGEYWGTAARFAPTEGGILVNSSLVMVTLPVRPEGQRGFRGRSSEQPPEDFTQELLTEESDSGDRRSNGMGRRRSERPEGRSLPGQAEVGGRDYDDGYTRLVRRCVNTLESGGVVLLFDNAPVVTISSQSTYEFLWLIVRDKSVEEKRARIPTMLAMDDVPVVVLDWLEAYVPPIDLRKSAESALTYRDQIEAQNMAAIRATQRLAAWNYPLSILGMLSVVLGMGHLLSSKPVLADHHGDSENDQLINSTIGKSVALIAGMSGLDLVWTLLAHQAGAMTEVNPIGNELIGNPELLILFKIGLTAAALLILYSSRRHRTAQLASWWTCLILVLVTARWLTVSSLVA